MKILIASLLKRKVTPQITASRSRIIYELTKGLVAKGHQVTLCATADSEVPGAKIIGVIPKSLNDLEPEENQFYAETGYLVQLSKRIEKEAASYDIIHNHTYPEFINLFVGEKVQTPMVTTVHAQATEQLDATLSLFSNAHIICLSKAQRRNFHKTKIGGIVYNGIDTNLYSYLEKKQDYLLWIGRLSKAKKNDGTFVDPKGIQWAIRLAKETGERLLLSGNVEDRSFFEQEVQPYLNDRIEWVGDISSEQPLSKEAVVKLMQGAKAFLMTVNWEEPFGLVMAEAMSCGTPVIGFDRGAVSEIVADGKTGFVVKPDDGLEGLKKALSKIATIRSIDCRKHVETHFSIERMVQQYETVYDQILQKK